MKFWLFVLLSILTGQFYAQNYTGVINGYIKADADNKPLPFSTFRLMKSNTIISGDTGRTTVSDSMGFFEFRGVSPGKYQLQAQYPGFHTFDSTLNVTAGKITRLDIRMHEYVIVEDPIFVQRSSKSESIEPIDVLTKKDFVRNPTTNVFDALAYSTGIYCDIDQGMTNPVDININGLEGNYTMYTIDGVPAMNNLAGIFALSAFPTSLVNSVEIDRGANSTVYGSDAMSGVINITTQDPATAPTVALNAMLTSKLESELGLTMAFHLKKVNLLLAVDNDQMNYRWDINHDNFMDIPLVNRASVFNKWSFVRKENRVAIIYARYLFEDRFTGQMNAPGRIVGSDQYYTQWLRTNQWQAGFKYQLPVREKIMLTGDYSEHYQQAWFDTAHYHGVLRNVYAELNWKHRFGKHKVEAGVTYRMKYYNDNTGLSNPALTGIGPFVHTAGFFVQDEIQFDQRSALYFGARFDYSNQIGPIGAPRIVYRWNGPASNTIRFAVGTGYRVPNVLNEGFTALETSRQVIVPQKLKTEYDVSMNLDYIHTQNFPLGSLTFEGNIFAVYLTNYVEPDYQTDSAAVIYDNNKGGGTAGMSAGLDWQFQFPLRLGFNCTWAYTFELDNDSGEIELDTPTHAPPFTANFFISYTIPKAGVTFDLTGDLISPMILATVPNDYRPYMSPWFSILNIQVTKKFKKGFELFAGVKNLLNFVQQDPILRPYDPFNRYVNINNPNGYRFDTTYAYSTIEGIKGFFGFRYTLK